MLLSSETNERFPSRAHGKIKRNFSFLTSKFYEIEYVIEIKRSQTIGIQVMLNCV